MTILSTRPVPVADSTAKIGVVEQAPATAAGFAPSWMRPVVVERLMAVIDAALIVVSGIGCAAGYHIVTAGTLGKADVYAAASVLVAINFVLLTVVQHGYRLKNFTNLARTFRLTLTTWTGLFGALLAIAFTMKVSEEFSRGTTISFYLVGLAVLLAWKIAAARWTAHALRTGAFANGRAIMIAEFGLATSSNAVEDLGQHGYRLMRVMEIPAKDLASPLLLSQLAPRFEELIAFARENRIEHVFLLMNWSRQHAIDSILDALKILPIPVHLVPDPNAARFLRYPLVSTGNTFTAELRRAPLSWNERALADARPRRREPGAAGVRAGDAGDRTPDQAELEGPGVLPPDPPRLRRARVQDLQVSHHARAGGRPDHRAGGEERPARHGNRQMAAQDLDRRAAAALQRAQGRHVAGRPPPARGRPQHRI